MHIEYAARDFDLDDEIRAYAETKLQKIEKFLEEPIDVRIMLEVSRHHQIAEVHVSHRFGSLQATHDAAHMRDALNVAVDKLEKQARRSRKKLLDQRHRGPRHNGSEWPISVIEKDSLQAGELPRIVKSSALQIKPMSLDEAALQLTQSEHDFVVFRDSINDRVSVLFKRRDENYGLISPE